MIWIFLAIYFLGMLALGLYFSRRQTSASEFIAADRGLGYWVASFSARATGESGWLILGLSGTGFVIGMPAMWVVLGEVIGVAISWLFLIPRFKREVDQFGSLTMLDYFETKLSDHRHRLRKFLAFVVIVMVSFYLAGQFSATGKAFSSFFGMDPMQGMLIGAGIVLVYVTLGGFRAVAVSDFIQGILMVIGLVAVPVVGIVEAGGFGPIIDKAAEVGYLKLYPNAEMAAAGGLPAPTSLTAIVLGILGMMAVGLGFLGSPQIYQRIIALNGSDNLGKATGVAIGYTTIVGTAAVFAGIVGRYYFAELADAETVFPDLVQNLFPPLIGGLALAVILSAIMSTADSLMIMASTTVVFDLVKKVYNPDLSEKRTVYLLRVVTFVLCAVGLVIAAFASESIYFLVLFAWAGIASAFCPTLIMTLFYPKTTRTGALAGAVAGFLTAFAWKQLDLDIVYEMVPAFAVAFLVIYVVSGKGEAKRTTA